MEKDKKIVSYVKNGGVYFKNTGGYHEVSGFHDLSSERAKGFDDGGFKQKNLVIAKSNSAAAITIRNAMKELGW